MPKLRHPTASPLGIGLRVARIIAGLNEDELAQEAGVRASEVRRAERGWVVQDDKLIDIASALANRSALRDEDAG